MKSYEVLPKFLWFKERQIVWIGEYHNRLEYRNRLEDKLWRYTDNGKMLGVIGNIRLTLMLFHKQEAKRRAEAISK